MVLPPASDLPPADVARALHYLRLVAHLLRVPPAAREGWLAAVVVSAAEVSHSPVAADRRADHA